MNYRIIIPLVLATVVGLSSCKKFLEEQTQDQLVPKSTRDYSEMLFGDGYPRTLDPMVISTFLMDDDVSNYTDKTYGDRPDYLNDVNTIIDVYAWQPDFFEQLNSRGVPGMRDYNSWYTYFSKISACNIALQNADNSIGTQSEIDNLKGEAYTLRAYYYFMLVNLYGQPYNATGSDRTKNPGVPIILSPDFRNEYYKRASVDEVYKQIVSDLNAGITLLEKEKKITTIYRINYKAAHLLASRVFLYMEDWDKSIEHATAVLNVQSSLLQLNGWGTPNAGNKPIITATNVEAIWAYSTTNIMSVIKFGTSSGQVKFMLAQDLLDQYASDDLRKSIYSIPKLNSSYPADLGKWPYAISPSAQPYPHLFRVSEAFLNRAEAYIQKFRKGDAAAGQAAIDDLNTLRKSRINSATYADWTVSNADQMLTDCRNERRRELFLENHRWFDLRRYGMPAIEHVQYTGTTTRVKWRLEEKDLQYVLPIPGIVLQQNNLLEQNPLAPRRQSTPL
ncbi:MAG: RagB/SusD family nutrient uptake outer membrane protein [Chitinophagaceae bacterium]|nr:RagB/SusD family nutrient uptake outer membrane protein [Chitinophagaceae bacterium]